MLQIVSNRKKWLLILCIVCLVVIVTATKMLQEHSYLTTNELAHRIDTELPNGSSLEKVKLFISSYQPQFRIGLTNYEDSLPRQSDDIFPPSDLLPNTNGYLVTWVYHTGDSPENLLTWNIRMIFYFDKNKLLVGYKLQEIGDGL